MSMNPTTEYPIKLHTKTAQSSAAVYLYGITNQSVAPNLVDRRISADGQPHNTYGALVSGDYVGSFTTLDVKTFLDQIGAMSMLIDYDGSHPGVVMYQQAMTAGATRAGTGGISYTFTEGMIVPESLSCSHQGEAVASGTIHNYGTVTRASSVTLPTIYPSVSPIYTLGKVVLNATTIQPQNVNINFGVDVAKYSSGSSIYTEFVGARSFSPSITVDTLDSTVAGTIGLTGAYYTAAQVVIYFRKRSEGGSFVADGTAEHIKLTLGKARVSINSEGGSTPQSTSFVISPWYTAGVSPTYPILVATTSAIT